MRSVTMVPLWPTRLAMVTIGTSLSLMIETNVWRVPRGSHSSPTLAALAIARNAQRMLPAGSSVPVRVKNTRLLSLHSSPALKRCAAEEPSSRRLYLDRKSVASKDIAIQINWATVSAVMLGCGQRAWTS